MSDMNGATGPQQGNQQVEQEAKPEPIQLSIKDNLPDILLAITGRTDQENSGLAAEAETTISMRQLKIRHTAEDAQAENKRNLAVRLRSEKVNGQLDFKKAVADYQKTERFIAERSHQRLSNLAAANDKTLTEAARKEAAKSAQAIQNTIGGFKAHYTTRLADAAALFGGALLNHRAVRHGRKILDIKDHPELAYSTSVEATLVEMIDALEREAVEHEKNKDKLEKTLAAETVSSRKRRAKIASEITRLRAFATKEQMDAAHKNRKIYLALVADRDKKKASLAEKKRKKSGASNAAIAAAQSASEAAEAKLKAHGSFPEPDEVIVEALSTIADSLPANSLTKTGNPRRIAVEGLAAAVKLRMLEAEYETVRTKLRTATDNFKPGSSTETSLDFEFGLGTRIVPGVKLEGTGIVGLKLKIERTKTKSDDRAWKATYEKSAGISVNLKAGDVNSDPKAKNALKANLQAAIAAETARTYDSLEELMTGESEVAMKMMFFASNTDMAKAEKAAAAMLHERQRLIALAHQSERAIGTMLMGKSDSPVELELSLPAFAKGARLTASSKAIGAGAGAAAGFSTPNGHSVMGAISGAYQHKRKTEQVDLYLPYLDQIRKDPKRQKQELMAHSHLFGFFDDTNAKAKKVVYGKEAVTGLDALEEEIRTARSDLNSDDKQTTEAANDKLETLRGQVWQNLEVLRFEYDQFVMVENGLNQKRLKDTEATRQTRNRPLLRRKLAQNDRAGFVRAMSLQFSVLERLHSSTVTDGKPVAPAVDEALAAFRVDLETPKLGLTSAQLKKEFGFVASGDVARVNNNTISFGFTAGWKKGAGITEIQDGANTIDDGAQGGDDKDGGGKAKKDPTGLAGISLNAEANFEERWKPGDAEPEKKLTIEFALSHGGGVIIDEKALVPIVGKLLSGTDLLQNHETEALQQNVARSLLALGKELITNGPVKLELVRPTGKPTGWSLKETSVYTVTDRKIGLRPSIPLGATGVDLVLGFNMARKTKRLRRSYRAVGTLSGIGETFRANNATGTVNDSSWVQFKKDSRLLPRLVEQLRVEVGWGGDFDTYLERLQAGQKVDMNKTPLTTDNKKRAGLATDLIALLQDLKDGDSSEADAADNLIEKLQAYHKASGTKSRTKARNALERAFDRAIVKKSAKEVRTYVDDYQKPTFFTSDEIKNLLISDLTEHFENLQTEIGPNAESDLVKVRSQLMSRYQNAKTEKNLKLLKQALSISYAAGSIDDLSRSVSESDKDAALGQLASDMTDLIGGQPRVYVDPMIDGELVEKNGKLELNLIVKKGYESAVDLKMLQAAHRRATKRLNNGADHVGTGFAIGLVTIEETNSKDVRKRWNKSMHDLKAEKAAFQKLADRYEAPKTGASRHARRKRYRESYGRQNHDDLIKAIAAVLDQQKKAKKRNPSKASSH